MKPVKSKINQDKSRTNQNKSNKSEINQDKSNKSIYSICPVLIPTLDGSADVSTIHVLDTVIRGLNREPVYITSMGNKGISNTRTWLFKSVKRLFEANGFKSNVARGFIIDSDICLLGPDSQKIFNYVLDADTEKRNFVIPYNFPSGQISVFKENENKNLEMLDRGDKLPEFTKCAGLGFYYGDIPLDYVFHNDVYAGEDVYFFLDNFKLEQNKVVKDIKLLHKKLGFF